MFVGDLKGKKMLGENSHFSAAYPSQKVLNLCYRQTHTHLNRMTHTALKYITDANIEVSESAKLAIVCTTAQNILLGQVKQQESYHWSEEAIMHSWLQYVLSALQDKILSGLFCGMDICTNLWVCNNLITLEFTLVVLHNNKECESKHGCYSFSVLQCLSTPVWGNVTEFPWELI